MKTILVTGGAGFIGSNFIRYIIDKNVNVINLDKLTYAGNLNNLKDIEESANYKFIQGDICSKDLVSFILKEYKVDYIVNFAAESHVDRSIIDSTPFYQTNVIGTLNLMDCTRKAGIEKFLQVSTDEVYGSLGTVGKFKEETPLAPNSPYSASKAAADQAVIAYNHTFGFPALITRCSNNYGPYQFPEKLIPLVISNALANKSIPVYGTGENVRDWIYVEDHCRGIYSVLMNGNLGEVYNIGGESEVANIDLVKNILQILKKSDSLISFVQDRPGHDLRYAIDIGKVNRELNWSPGYQFEDGLEKTINWYLTNQDWLNSIINGEYKDYYKQQYSR